VVPAAKFLAAATKNLFVVPNFVAVTNPFFSVTVNKPDTTYCIFLAKVTTTADIVVTLRSATIGKVALTNFRIWFLS